jgi:hypothetical protein
MLKNTDHCKLCEHHKRSLDIGIICGLTDKPPAFNTSCNQIQLDETFKEEIERINVKHYQLVKRKFDIIGGIILFPILGFLILYSDYWFYHNYYRPNFLETFEGDPNASAAAFGVLALIFVAGIVMIAKGTGPLFQYINDKKYVTEEKEKLDEVCRLNGVKYEIEYYPRRNFFDKEVHIKGIQLKKTAIIR